MNLGKMTTGDTINNSDLLETSEKEENSKCAACECHGLKNKMDLFTNIPEFSSSIDSKEVQQTKLQTTKQVVTDTALLLSNYFDAKSRFCNIYGLKGETLNTTEKSDIKKLYAKSDLLGTLRELLEKNVNMKTDLLKHNLNKMQSHIGTLPATNEEINNENTNGFNKQEVSFIKEQVDKILLEAEILVNGLLSKSFDNLTTISNEIDYYCAGFSPNFACNDVELSKNGNLSPLLLDEHILEAPEGFRSSSEQFSCDGLQKIEPNELNSVGILLVEGLKCHSDAAPVEPERPVVTNHGDDNKPAQEVDTYRRAEQEEIKTCENDSVTYDRESHANFTSPTGNETNITFTITTDSDVDVNRGNELEKVSEEINGFKVNDCVKLDATECSISKFKTNIYRMQKKCTSKLTENKEICLTECGSQNCKTIEHKCKINKNEYKINEKKYLETVLEQEQNAIIHDDETIDDKQNEINFKNCTLKIINSDSSGDNIINRNEKINAKSSASVSETTTKESSVNKNQQGEDIKDKAIFKSACDVGDYSQIGNIKKKTFNLTVSDKPKMETFLQQRTLNKKSDLEVQKFTLESSKIIYNANGNVDNRNPTDSALNTKIKSPLNLVVADKPSKKSADKMFSDSGKGNTIAINKRKSNTQNELNEDNSHSVIEVRHVGSTTTTPTHFSDTLHENVNYHSIECRKCNETAVITPEIITTSTFKNKSNLKNIKVDLNDLYSTRSNDERECNKKNGMTCSSNPTVRGVSSCRCAEPGVDTARISDMPKSTTTTSATVTTLQTSSIETGVERCAELPGCSRESTVSARVAFDTSCTFPATKQDTKSIENDRHGVTVKVDSVCPSNIDKLSDSKKSKCAPVEHLSWSFRNGRLVFEDVVASSPDNGCESENTNILTSKDLNRKTAEGRQLKLLEQKLKRAGITDEIKSNPILPPNIKSNKETYNDLEEEEDDLIPEYEHLRFCEFDPNNTNLSSLHFDNDADFYLVYDELLDNEDIIIEMRGEGGMGTNVERKQHNPNHDNLKSLLKKPGHGKDSGKKNRVVFNETKNEFFDADYIILIREECDYDDEDDDGICTCNQHEMVRLTCCEPNCNCNAYDGFGDPTPQSPKFAPPLEFVDSVTLSPPEEYKDMELEEQQLMALQQIARRGGQRPPVCRECSASHEDEGDGSQSDNEEGVTEIISDHDETEEKEKTDQSQQTTPTTPPADTDAPVNNQRYILETLSMTTVTERQVIKEIDDRKPSLIPNLQPGDSPISGILKGGRLWKQTGTEINNQVKVSELQQPMDSNVASDEESGNRRFVRFIESRDISQRDVCDGASDKTNEEETKSVENESENNQPQQQNPSTNNSLSPESTEMMLTFKLGNHVLISNNSLKPNSAVRQLFPCTKALGGKIGEEDSSSVHQYLVTAESLRAFEEAKRSKLPQIIQSGETDDSIRKAIERNTLRRSLIRYEPKSRKPVQKTDNSLVERIKQLTCNVEEDLNPSESDDISQRATPPGEEARNSPEVICNKNQDKSFSPSSSSTTSSNSSSMSSTCRKFTDLFSKREKTPDIQNVNDQTKVQTMLAPDLGNGSQEFTETSGTNIVKNNPGETRKQFLSTLAPLTACVSGIGPTDDYYHTNNHTGDRTSVASSVGTEYSLEDIDEVLRKDEEESKKIAPDVLAGTPSASESGDELAMFVQQDAGRIERIKKKYQPETTEEDDEHDDYGFNRRPSVRGIKPKFGSTTEILQQIQNQMQLPNNTPPRNHIAWPYYSETNLTGMDNSKSRNVNQNLPPYPYPNASSEDIKRSYVSHQYRPNYYVEENIYQNCANQRCTQVNYRTNMNLYPSVVRVGGGCSDYYTSLPRNRNGRPQSPPPQEVSKTYHQTMVYIPYNHIEGYHPVSPNPYYTSANDACYARVTNQNQINKRYLDPSYQQRVGQPIEDHYQKTILRPNYPSANHIASSRSESPLPGQFSTARSTQTPSTNISTCTYYPPRYRPIIGPVNAIPPNGLIWQGEGNYASKINRHSFPRYPPSDSISLTDSDSQHSGQIPNGYRQPIDPSYSVQKDSMPNSPTKPRFIERGVPEGAASVSPQDSVNAAQNTSTMTSPISPQNPPPPSTTKPLFYAMNV